MALASSLAAKGDEVTLIGSGEPRPNRPYRFIKAAAVRRERFEHFPRLPTLRSESAWEELSFVPGLLRAFRPDDYDITLTCSYPFTNWALRRPGLRRRPPHVFVTQNGDWPAFCDTAEFRLFGCEGLVCINPDYFERNASRYRAALIPNGVDQCRFSPGPPQRAKFGISGDGPVILMVSALIPSKNVADGIDAVSLIPDAQLVIAGDGPLRDELRALAEDRLGDRHRFVQVASVDMPDLYRTADVFMHLSRDESFGNVYLEAMACGIPTVAYDLPRTRWIVGEQTHLVAGSDAAAVAASIRAALGAKNGQQERLLARAQSFGWASVSDRYRDFLADVVAAQK